MKKENLISLKNMRSLFMTGSERLTSRQVKRLDAFLEAYPQLKTIYYLKEAFCNIYQFAKTREEAEQMYVNWIQANKDENCHDFDSFINTVENWHTEIFNYFDNHYTTAQTERLNKVIREIDRAGRGYTFPVLRAKILFRHITKKKGKHISKK